MKVPWRRVGAWSAGAVALYAVVGFLVAPPIVRHQLEKALSEQLGRNVGIESVRINPFTLSTSVRGFSVKGQDGSTTVLGFEDLTVNVALSSLPRRGLIVEAIDLTRPYVRAVRLADGRYDFQDVLDRLASGPPAPPAPAPRFAIYNIQVHDGRLEFEDRPQKAQHAITELNLGVPFVSSMPAEIDIRVAPRLTAKVNGAPFEIAGETTPFKDRYVTTVRFDLDDLQLGRYLEYSPVPLRIRIPSGRLNTRLVLTSSAVPGNRLQTLVLSGTASVDNLKVLQADEAPLLSLAKLGVELEALDLLQRKAVVTAVRIEQPEIDILRQKDGRLGLASVAPQPAPAPPAAPATQSTEPPFLFAIGRLALSKGRVRFIDRSLEKPLALALDDLSLAVEGLGNAEDKGADVKLRARIGRAPLELSGKVALAPLSLDLKANARQIALVPLSQYSILYAGYGIERGTLSLKQAFVVRDRKLTAQNNIVLDQFTFGDKVDSPGATSLPVAFALSLLKDENGVIDLNVPVSGALDDPQVGIGEVIASAFRSPLEKAATSPFALLGAPFGAGEELAYLDFLPGSAALEADGAGKLKILAAALAGRPGLRLDIAGRADPQADGEKLKRDNPKSTDEQIQASLRSLADARAQAAKDWLVDNGKISLDRLSVVASRIGSEGIQDNGKPARVDFSLGH